MQDIPAGCDLLMYLQCWCVGVWYRCKLFSMQCVNRELITFACTWAIRMHIKVQSEYVQAQFQSGCWAINWIYGLFIDLVCWIVCVEYHISYGGQSCYIDLFFPIKSLAFAVSQRILSSCIWTSDVLSYLFFWHYTCRFWPTHTESTNSMCKFIN